jgi:phosphoenolpyruvate synthase/pyruvate phosphate dikinase
MERLSLSKKIAGGKNAKKILNGLKNGRLEKMILEYPELKKIVEGHIKKFGWLTYAYSGPVMTIEHLNNLLSDSLKDDIDERIKKIKNHYKDIKKEKEKIIKELALPEELVYLFRVSAELMYMKDYRKGIYQKSYVAMDPILEEMGRRIGLNLTEIKYLSAAEISAALLQNKKDYYRDVAKQRFEKCCYLVEDGKIQIFEGEKREKMIKKYIGKLLPINSNKNEIETREIRGTTAYGGKASGRVRIILVVEDVAKMEEGDVLVSSSTNPDLILAMKKASAFVTDIGGIVSHAAIIAREMKKPCIVGTKIATHILKDGDLVEVDADKGIVKIL